MVMIQSLLCETDTLSRHVNVNICASAPSHRCMDEHVSWIYHACVQPKWLHLSVMTLPLDHTAIVYIYIYVYLYVYTHTHTHTHIYINGP